MNKLFITLALLFCGMSSLWAADGDSTVVTFDFATTGSTDGAYTGSLKDGARLTTFAGQPVLALGDNGGYFDFGEEFGKTLGSLSSFSITTDVFIPETTDTTANGNFIWCFANSSSTGYLFYSAKGNRYAISKTDYTGEEGMSVRSTLFPELGRWFNVAVIMRPNGRVYISINGMSAGMAKVSITPADLNELVQNYLGRSCYAGDKTLKGAMYTNFKLWNYDISSKELGAIRTDAVRTAMNAYIDSVEQARKDSLQQIEDEATLSAFTMADLHHLIDNVDLPTTYQGGTVEWTTSDASVITADGIITRPPFGSEEGTATLTATLSLRNARIVKTFEVSVMPNLSEEESLAYDLENLTLSNKRNNLYDQLVLPTVGRMGTIITWQSGDTEWLSNTGRVLKASETEKHHVTLTATLLRGQLRQTKTFDVYIHQQEPYKNYLFVYFPSNSNENLYYAISEDGYNYTPLNNGQAFLKADTTTIMGGLRDPHILRGEDGWFYMAVTDMKCSLGWSSNRGLVLMKSNDLIHWTHHTVHFPTKYAGTPFANVTRVWAPETIWDPKAKKYMVYFSLLTNDGTIRYDKDYYCYANADFSDLEGEPTYLYDRGSATIDMDIVYNETDSLYHGFFKNESLGGICQVTASSLTAPEGAPLGSQWSAPSATLQQTTEAVEGAGVFKLINQDSWVLMYDCYTAGHYQFCSSPDLTTFTFVQNTTMSGAFTPRHGTVIPITEEETAALLAAFPPETGTTLALQGANDVNVKQENVSITATSAFIPVEQGTDLSHYDPLLETSLGATVTPQGPQDFTKGPVTYTVSDGTTTKTYAVTVEADGNPILPGFHADPEVLASRKTGRFYVYPTSDGYASWGGSYFDVFSSPDLVHFTNEGTILNLKSGGDVAWATGNAWAPCIEEKWMDGKWKYFFYFSGQNKNLNTKTLGVAVADNPTGPFKAAAKPIVSSTSGGQMIDSDVFTDPESGQTYFYYGNGQMHYRLLADDMMSTVGDEYTITPSGGSLSDYAYREGTYVFYRNGIYYFLWSVDDTGAANYHVAYGTAKSPTGPIEVAANPIVIIQDPSKEIYGTGHNSVVNVPGTDDWYIVYHRINKHYLNNSPGVHREVCVEKLTFDDNGRINPVTPTREGISPVDNSALIDAATAISLPQDGTAGNGTAQVTGVTYYSVDGTCLGTSAPQTHGIYVRKEMRADGTTRSLKIVR